MYWITMVRTTMFGLGSPVATLAVDFLVFFFLVFPFAALVLLGRNWRTFNFGLLTVALAGVIVAEGFSLTQEVLVLRRYGREPDQKVFIERWAPFEGHGLFFQPGVGWTGID
jgi:hypothetical protein